MLTPSRATAARKSLKQLAGWERGLLLGAFIVTTVSAGMLISGEGPRNLFRRWSGTLDPTGSPFARVQSATGDIKRQAARSARLTALQKEGETVYFGDTLYTGSQSSILLNLLPENGGGSFTVGPDSMIRISSTSSQQFGSLRKNSEVELVKGSIRGEKGKEAPIRISTPTTESSEAVLMPVNEEIRVEKVIPRITNITAETPPPLDSDSPLLTPAAQTSPVQMPSALPELTAMEAPIVPVEIPKNESLSRESLISPESSNSALERIRPQIIEPARNALIPAHDFSGTSLDIKWLLEGGSAVSSWKLISKESGKVMQQGDYPAKAQGAQTLKLITPGRYEFVLQVGNNRTSTEFTLDSKIELTRAKSASLSPEAPKFVFDLPTSLPDTAKNLRLELFRFERDETPSLVREINASMEKGPLEIAAEEIGRLSFFRWAVYPEGSSGKDSFYGMSPKTQILAALPAPTLTSPEPTIELPAKSTTGEPMNIVFTWKRVPLSEEYILEISKSPDFLTTEKSARTDANYMDFALSEVGHYWWRVRCDSERAQGVWSQPRGFKVISGQ